MAEGMPCYKPSVIASHPFFREERSRKGWGSRAATGCPRDGHSGGEQKVPRLRVILRWRDITLRSE
jgi:hypothetical protein